MTACTYGDFIELPHWDVMVISTMAYYPTQSHYPDTDPTSHSLPYPINAERWASKRQVSILKSLV